MKWRQDLSTDQPLEAIRNRGEDPIEGRTEDASVSFSTDKRRRWIGFVVRSETGISLN